MSDKQHANTRARRGRPPMNKAKRDFLVGDAIEEYAARKKMHRADRGALPPYEAAAEEMRETRKALGHIGSKRLLNEMSEFKKVDVLASEEISPDEYDPPDHLPDLRSRR